MICFLDLDGVIADFTGSALTIHGTTFEGLFPTGEMPCYFLHEAMGISNAEFWEPIVEAGPAFWANLNPMPDADRIVLLLEAHFDEDEICILSSPSATHCPKSMEGKFSWLMKHQPQFEKRFLFGPAKEYVSGPGKILIDDFDKNVDAFREAGGEAILIPRPWNSLAGHDTLFHLISELGRIVPR